jgi:signal transduction histidine kinase
MKPLAHRYAALLEQAAQSAAAAPSCAKEAARLGRRALLQGALPQELLQLHREAMAQLVAAHPEPLDLALAERILELPLEAALSYGEAYREQLGRGFLAQMEVRLAQAYQMQAACEVAAGVAHDVNNLLGSIMGFAEMAGDEVAPGSVPAQHLQLIVAACTSARDLLSSQLAFVRNGRPAPAQPVDLVQQARDTIALVRASHGPGIKLRLECLLERAVLIAEPMQPQQLLMNLCINAVQASEPRGEVVVRVEPAVLAAPPGVVGRPAVCVSVIDHGHGMPAAVRERMFEPFFSTKDAAQGSGLGLSVVQRIVTRMGGAIRVQSQSEGPARGTTVAVQLPLAGQV